MSYGPPATRFCVQARARGGDLAGRGGDLGRGPVHLALRGCRQSDHVLAGGQTIKLLPVSGATKIGVIGSARNGPSTGQMTITYSDGTTQQVSLVLSDWTLNARGASPSARNIETATTPYRNSGGGQAQTINTYLFSASFPVTAGKPVASMTLPASTDQGSIHLFAAVATRAAHALIQGGRTMTASPCGRGRGQASDPDLELGLADARGRPAAVVGGRRFREQSSGCAPDANAPCRGDTRLDAMLGASG